VLSCFCLIAQHSGSHLDISATLAEVSSLNVDDRLRLVEAIWDNIIAENRQPELTEAQKQELKRRLARHAASPEDVVSWEEVKREALARARR
jgi:putative addiction module component (TIGR02574 family)